MFDTSKSITIIECLIKVDGSYEEWRLCSRRSRAMRLEKCFPPPPGWKGLTICESQNRMIDVDLTKTNCGNVTVYPKLTINEIEALGLQQR